MMKKSSKKHLTLLILFLSVLIFSMLTVSAAVASTHQIHTTYDDNVEIETKFKKVSTNKITFNANGGKIGTKKSTVVNVRKGAKINKFPTTPKRAGYTFKGWYTKKTGGKKIAVSNKPTKSITLYAQWKKKTSSKVLTAEEKKLLDKVGWKYKSSVGESYYLFSGDGTYGFTGYVKGSMGISVDFPMERGNWSLKNGVLRLNYQESNDKGKTWSSSWKSVTKTIIFGVDLDGTYFYGKNTPTIRYYKGVFA